MKANVLRSVQPRGGLAKKNCCDILYVEYTAKGRRTQVELCGKFVIMFRSEERSALSSATSAFMTTEYIQTCDEHGKEVLASRDSGSV